MARLFFIFFALSCLPILLAAQSKGNVMAEAKFGLIWEVPKSWTKSAVKNGVKYASKKGEDYIVVTAQPIPSTQEEKEKAIVKFLKDEVSIYDYASFAKDAKSLTHNGLKVLTYTEDDEPDLEEAEDPEDYEGLWTKILITEHKDKLVMISITEIYNKRRKLEKELNIIFNSIKPHGK